MSVSVGKSYHIKDSFFSLVNDSKLMVNKEGNNYRPHFFIYALMKNELYPDETSDAAKN